MKLRFPDVAPGGAHYESVYSVLSHPSEPRAIWIRTTVRKRPQQGPVGAVWVTWFDHQAVRAGKVDDLPVTATGQGINVGDAHQGLDGTRGALELPTIEARWEVDFTAHTAPLEHLTPARLYRLPMPRTKSTSPIPSLTADGTVTIDGATIDVSGWTGMLGHNWGREHAARWAWLRAEGLGVDGTGWLDAVFGRVRIGGALTPWTAFGALHLDGERHRLGGLARRGTAVDVRSDGADLSLRGTGVTVLAQATVDLGATVGWQYADPGGHQHEVVNSSVASLRIVLQRGGERTVIEPDQRGVLELGADRRAFDVPLQPFPDG